MPVWTIANQKGGVGKTTTVVSLAGLLSRAGKRTLLVDLDPHGSMTTHFGFDPDAVEASSFRLFERGITGSRVPIASLIAKTQFDNVCLVPASPALATVDRLVGQKDGMGHALSKTLSQCQSRFDYVLVDCPPVFGVLMLNALAAW